MTCPWSTSQPARPPCHCRSAAGAGAEGGSKRRPDNPGLDLPCFFWRGGIERSRAGINISIRRPPCGVTRRGRRRSLPLPPSHWGRRRQMCMGGALPRGGRGSAAVSQIALGMVTRNQNGAQPGQDQPSGRFERGRRMWRKPWNQVNPSPKLALVNQPSLSLLRSTSRRMMVSVASIRPTSPLGTLAK